VEGYDTRTRPFTRSEGRLRATGHEKTIGARATVGFELCGSSWAGQPRVMVPSLWARVFRQPMKFNLKQGSGAVAGELLVDVAVRTRTAILSFTRNNSRVDGSFFGASNGSLFGAVGYFIRRVLTEVHSTRLFLFPNTV